MVRYNEFPCGTCNVEVAEFRVGTAEKEYHIMLHPAAEEDFEKQYKALDDALESFIREKAPMAVPVFMRWFLSDSASQQEMIASGPHPCAVSIVEQPPLDGTKVALWVWLAEGAAVREESDGMWSADFCGARHMWTTGDCRKEGDSEMQTADIFRSYSRMLQTHGCTLKENCIRTWLFVNDIDVNYGGVVKGRREFFELQGLTSQTHYIASTGIAGRAADSDSKVIMDTYALADVSEDKVRFLKGSTHLNPTHEYGVTFERGTSVTHADRSHVFLSGTASIDNKGEIVHPGDIAGQTLRMIENVGVLLEEAGCTFGDVMHMIVYLRNMKDYDEVYEMIMERFPEHPKVFLLAPVCRPGWLVEMECMAVKQNQ
jgi:enamine deaminase RidA (YjgF/YER057c/UK114 family)